MTCHTICTSNQYEDAVSYDDEHEPPLVALPYEIRLEKKLKIQK